MTNRFLVLFAAVAVLGCSTTTSGTQQESAVPSFGFSWERSNLAAEDPATYANVLNLLDSDKPMLALYREDLTHDAVVRFFVDLTGSPEIALPILYHADRADISLSLVFSLSWVESRYAPGAINRNATSIDRGLFQLNSRTFVNLTEEDFFHPDTNTYHGIQYLAWCLEHTTSDWEAVAVYNAGLTRVRAGRTPQSTLIYVERIRQFRTSLDQQFRQYMVREFPFHNT
jgi:soluble lytic murein transglycosylase-like protein